MPNRHHYTLNTYSTEQKNKKKQKVLFNSRSEVDINGNGTSGYTVKNGPNKGKILGHRSQKHSNNW